jgi:hypothetical protein
LVYNFYATPGTLASFALNTTTNCVDNSNLLYKNNGWRTATSARQWITGIPMNSTGTGYMSDIPAGAIGGFYTSDPDQGTYIEALFSPNQTTDSSKSNNSVYLPNANGCQFDNTLTETYGTDLNWLPGQDVFGNEVAASNEYLSLGLTSGYNNLTGTAGTDWPHTHAAALNATDNAAYNVRTNATLPAYVFVIGLGGNDGNPPDPILLQRMANDSSADQFNSPAAYPACSAEPSCVNYPSQPQGQFIYSPTDAQLGQAFLAISSQILRLSH